MARLLGNFMGAIYVGVVSLGFIIQGLLTLGVIGLILGGYFGLW